MMIIDNVTLTPLKQFVDPRGAVFHYLKSSSPTFVSFGEAYFSKINEAVVKGWKKHKRITQNFCVPFGAVKIVIYDDRKDSKTAGMVNEYLLDDLDHYCLLSVPPMVWYSFMCVSKGHALLANIIDEPHSPEESDTADLNSNAIPYDWTNG
ncbi:MAG: dTDP-4-dehydrorhamnose 3,5-epimerase family protein [Chitinophagaceae bacterium]|nr:dTDP-4-dehydrorhamnose 3,5-epimerase family protein [Chitinophagaceae bacterium]MCA6459659.1 dTDP-4-dehydrorhamnose 3,5-epimerase family protein [Chitinophagaceae bacterium]MCA6464526.1 dTDP-4-dehydrorhamnose 3,5-epimerase family protein [Chitinophagaceae bacterium]